MLLVVKNKHYRHFSDLSIPHNLYFVLYYIIILCLLIILKYQKETKTNERKETDNRAQSQIPLPEVIYQQLPTGPYMLWKWYLKLSILIDYWLFKCCCNRLAKAIVQR